MPRTRCKLALGLVYTCLLGCGGGGSSGGGATASSAANPSPPVNPAPPNTTPPPAPPPVTPNTAPIVVHPNGYQFVAIGESVAYDVTRGGTAFLDQERDAMRYEITFLTNTRGLTLQGTTITGVLGSAGLVRVLVAAVDTGNARAEDVLSLVAAAAEPGVPELPATPYAYGDADLLSATRLNNVNVGGRDSTPADNPTTNAGAALGRVLFYDTRLSITNTMSCASCHEQAHGFSRPEPFSRGFNGDLTKRNVMPLANVRFNQQRGFFSDMRAASLEELALMPIVDPAELGNTLPMLEAKLTATSFYPSLFSTAFGSPEITADRIARALAQFLRALVSIDAKLDRAMHAPAPATDANTMTAQELQGQAVFEESGCFMCHVGAMHIVRAANTGLDAEFSDPGAENGAFRAASLRNVAASGPYMHDGRFATLLEVIEHYNSGVQFNEWLDGRLQTRPPDSLQWEAKRLNLSESDKLALEAFLRTLTDETFLTDPRFADPFPH